MNNKLLICLCLATTGCDAISPFVGEDLVDSVCDRDGDGLARPGWCGGEDCDDGDAGVDAATGWYRDVDGDGFGAGDERFACAQPEGYVALAGDCDDTDELVNHSAIEVCDDIDNDCDGGVDDENLPVWYADKDQDGWGHEAASIAQCDQPDGYVDNGADCDDGDAASYPGAQEVCDDLVDQDCNGLTDDAMSAQLWCKDLDLDGFGDPDNCLFSCQDEVPDYVANDSDCNDTDIDISPAASEACLDSIDNDCDGTVDTDAVDATWYRDSDEDGYGDITVTTSDCAPPAGYVGNAADCDDQELSVNPSAEEVCNNLIDDNCDGGANECVFMGELFSQDADLSIVAPSGAAQYGRALALGDVTGDGMADLIVGAFNDTTGGGSAGAVYIYAGPLADEGQLDGSIYSTRLTGAVGAQFGRSLLVADDLNDDGLPDLVVGSMGSETISIWFSPIALGDAQASSADATLTNALVGNYLERGHSMSQGDLNDDGLSDLVVGAYENNRAYVWFSPVPTGARAIETVDVVLSASWSTSLRFGTGTACGDFNGDGADDLIVGDTEYGIANQGSVSLFSGPIMGLDAWTLNLVGDLNDRLGMHLAAADLNGDGVDDALASSGQTFDLRLWWGSTLTPASIGTTTWATHVGATADLNGDGVDDLLLANSAAGGYICGEAACVNIVYGGMGSPIVTATWYTPADSNFAIVAIGAHDLSGDGIPDIVIGEPIPGLVRFIHGIGQ